jgi:hypothetical protein
LHITSDACSEHGRPANQQAANSAMGWYKRGCAASSVSDGGVGTKYSWLYEQGQHRVGHNVMCGGCRIRSAAYTCPSRRTLHTLETGRPVQSDTSRLATQEGALLQQPL